MTIRKALETQSIIFGIPALDLGLSFVGFILVCLLIMLLHSVLSLSPYFSAAFMLLNLVGYWWLLRFLRRIAKKKQPSFLGTWLGFLFVQPAFIEMCNPKFIKIK